MIRFKNPFISERLLTATALLTLLALSFSGCAILRKTEPSALTAYRAFNAGDYAAALPLFEKHIAEQSSKGEPVADSIYRDAGLSAFNLDKNQQALELLNVVRNSPQADAPTHFALALLNREADNLSREITALENYISLTPADDIEDHVRIRMFEVYVESRNFEKALEVWPLAEPWAKDNEQVLSKYFFVLEQTGNEEKQHTTAQRLLEINPQHTDALFFLGKHYFWMAENLYQAEMEAYQRNRTNRQYARLLQAFEVLNEDFRKSLQYFEKLWEIDPKPAYAQYLGNIHLRFDNKEKARYFHSRAGN